MTESYKAMLIALLQHPALFINIDSQQSNVRSHIKMPHYQAGVK